MDERVIRSMARWPDVPSVFGWLALDGRGQWLLKGETIANRTAREFIARNYTSDEFGRWYFQNGPQRVFVELHSTPWILRLFPHATEHHRLFTHTGQAVEEATAVYIDEHGKVLVDTRAGVGQLDDRDLELFSRNLLDANGEAIDDDAAQLRLEQLVSDDPTAEQLTVRIGLRVLPVKFVSAADAPAKFSFVRNPTASNDERATPND